jgi:hypothetical protein
MDKDKIMNYYKHNCEGKSKCKIKLSSLKNSKSAMIAYFLGSSKSIDDERIKTCSD